MMMSIRNLLATLLLLTTYMISAQNTTLALAKAELVQLAVEKQYADTDIDQPIISDQYNSNGITHIYYQQTVDQIGIYGSNASVHIKDGEVFSANINFFKGIEKRNIKKQFQVQALQAVAQLAISKDYPLSQTELLILEADDNSPSQATTISNAGISNRTIPLKLVFIEDEEQDLQLAWSVFIDEVDGANYKNFLINATTGAIEKEVNLTITCNFDHDHSTHPHEADFLTENRLENLLAANRSIEKIDVANSYNVYPLPIESPNFGNRSVVVSPWDDNPTASPNGWHQIDSTNYTSTRGNNVDAYEDSDRTNSATNGDAARTDGGATLEFDNALDVNGPFANYKKAAVTNLFYWSNITHDVWYNYGFDEPSGNFQEENFDRGGLGSDYVYAEAQDGSGTCNANFSPPQDGFNPRMQMFSCGNRDGDFDNGVIVHEYGHGISTRLTGGPGNSNCLSNNEQMGEGWSDWFGTVMTIQAGDVAAKARPMGTWLFQEGPTGGGIRPYPYSTDMVVNPMTYGTLPSSSISVPHGVGSVWATMLWDLTWAMIDRYGWDPDLYNGTGGNNKTMALVIESLKLQPCSPGFVDGRDAILQADRLLYGGDHQCLIWSAFARRGLGYSADQGSSNSKFDGTEAFDMPPSCTVSLQKTTNKISASLGEEITYTLQAINAQNNTLNNMVLSDFLPDDLEFVSASDGGQANGQTVTWPSITFKPGQGYERTITAKVKNDIVRPDSIFTEGFETANSDWTVISGPDATWSRVTNQSNTGSVSYFANGATETQNLSLTLTTAKGLTENSELIFHHYYDIESGITLNGEVVGWDGGVVQISLDNGGTWEDLGSKMTQNGYNLPTAYNFNAFSGRSDGWIETKVDLSAYANSKALIRFEMRYDYSITKEGWYIDDVQITNLGKSVINQAQISNGTVTNTATVDKPTNIVFEQKSSCTQNITADFNGTNIPTNDYRINADINSAGIIKKDAVVGFYAGNSIVLNLGFHAEAGSTFTAKIEDCEEDNGGGQNTFQAEKTTTIRTNQTTHTTTPLFNKNTLTIRPNPFSLQATIDYQVNTTGPLWIGLYDITGKVVKVLHRQSTTDAGNYQLNLDSHQLANGAYWLTMRTQQDVLTKKVFILKN